MGLDEESRRFISGMDEVAKGYDPEISRLVDELRYQQLGKPIVYAATPPSDPFAQRTVAALEALAGESQNPPETPPKSDEEELIRQDIW